MTIQKNYSEFILQVNTPTSHRNLLDGFKTTLPEIHNTVPIKQLINCGADNKQIMAFVAAMILRTSYSLSVSGNLKEGSALEIAKNVIKDYPLLSLEDINLLLVNGTKGMYGQIYRLDISIIYEWIRSYEEQKAQYVEENYPVEKVNVIPVKYDELSESTKKLVEEFKKELDDGRGLLKVPSVSNKEIADARNPLKPKSVSSGIEVCTSEQWELKQKRWQWMREVFDYRTGKPLETYIDFETWLNINK